MYQAFTIALAAVIIFTKTEASVCQNLTVPISVSARQGVFSLQAPTDTTEVTDFVLNISQQGHNYTQKLLTGVLSH